MPDFDALAASKRYFAMCRWSGNGWVNHKALCRAVRALGGTLTVIWE
jgi:hypothetical protein